MADSVAASRPRAVIRSGGATRGSAGQVTITSVGMAQIEADAAAGLSNATISARLGIDRHSLIAIRRRQPEVEEALERGRGKLEDEIVDLLLEQGRAGNTTALIWLSKNRLGWRDQGWLDGAQLNVQVNTVLT